MQIKSAAALIGLTVALAGCNTLAPAATPAPAVAAQPPAITAPQPAQPPRPVAAVPPGQAGPNSTSALAQSAPAQVVPVPPPAPAFASAGLTVVGDGSVQTPPDIAYVSAGVQSRGATAREAQDANTAAMTQVLSKVKALGIADADVRTSGVNLQPIYDRDPGRVSGYLASNQVTITVQDVRRAGELLDAAITAGANQSAGVQFGIKDDSALRRQALDGAVKSARAKADAIAAAAGVRIVAIASLSDEGGSAPPRPVEARAAVMAAAPGADVPLQPGQLSVTAHVRIVYQIQ